MPTANPASNAPPAAKGVAAKASKGSPKQNANTAAHHGKCAKHSQASPITPVPRANA